MCKISSVFSFSEFSLTLLLSAPAGLAQFDFRFSMMMMMMMPCWHKLDTLHSFEIASLRQSDGHIHSISFTIRSPLLLFHLFVIVLPLFLIILFATIVLYLSIYSSSAFFCHSKMSSEI